MADISKVLRSKQRAFLAGAILGTCAPSSVAPVAQEGNAITMATGIDGQQTLINATVSPDGSLGIVMGLTHFKVVDTDSGVVIKNVPADGSWTRAAVFDPDGKFMISVGSGGAKIWDVATFSLLQELPLEDLQTVAISADGSVVAAAGFSGAIYVWRPAFGWNQRIDLRTQGPIGALALSTNGDLLAGAQGYTDDRASLDNARILVWNLPSLTERWSTLAHNNDISSLEFVDDDRKLISAVGHQNKNVLGGTAKLWDAASGALLSDYNGYRGKLTDIGTANPADRHTYGVGRHSGVSYSLSRMSWDSPAVDVVCDVTEAVDRFGLDRTGKLLFGVARFATAVTVAREFPVCSSFDSIGVSGQQPSLALAYSEPTGVLSIVFREKIIGLDLSSGSPRFNLSFGRTVNRADVKGARLSPDQRSLWVLLDNSISIHDAEFGTELAQIDLSSIRQVLGRQYIDEFYLVDERTIAFTVVDPFNRRPEQTGAGNGELLFFDTSTRALSARIAVHTDDIYAVARHPTNPLLFTASRDGTVALIDLTSYAVVDTYSVMTSRPSQPMGFSLSPDGEAFVVTWSPPANGVTASQWKVGSRQPVWSYRGKAFEWIANYSADGSRVLIGGEELVELDAASGRVVGRLSGLSPGERAASAIRAIGDKAVVAQSDSGKLHFWHVTGPAPIKIAEAIVSPERWLAYTGGRFDVSAFEDLEGIGWTVSDTPNEILAPEVFMRDYYEPGLLGRLLAGERLVPVRPLENLNRVQPIVEITSAEWLEPEKGLASVRVRVARNRDAPARNSQRRTETDVYDLRLFRDGQLVAQSPERNVESQGGCASREPDGVELCRWREETGVSLGEDGTAVFAFVVQVPRRPTSQDVAFSAYAFNEDRVKSSTATRTLRVSTAIEERRPRAYLVTVGVNKTESSPAWDLQYAATDARRLSDGATKALRGTGVYEHVAAVRLVSADDRADDEGAATKANLRAVLDVLAGRRQVTGELSREIPGIVGVAKAEPEDLIVLSISSHGYTDERGVFHMVLADIGAGMSDTRIDENLRERSLSSDELSIWLRDIDAGEIVAIVDACHSEATVAYGGFKPGPMGSRGLGQLAYDKGMRILAASKSAQAAVEYGGDIKQGLLSFALLREGLELGKADFRPRDRRITMSEWLAFGAQEVPRLFASGRVRGLSAGSDDELETRAVVNVGMRAPAGYQQPVLFDFGGQRADGLLATIPAPTREN